MTKSEPTKKLKAPVDSFQRLRESFKKIASTPAGKDVLRFLMEESGFLASSITRSPLDGDLQSSSMFYNEGRRNLYLYSVRPYLTPEQRSIIEGEWSYKPNEKV